MDGHSDEPIRFGLIGTGWRAAALAEAVVEHPGATLAAEAGGQFGAGRSYDEAEALLGAGEVDALLIAPDGPAPGLGGAEARAAPAWGAAANGTRPIASSSGTHHCTAARCGRSC